MADAATESQTVRGYAWGPLSSLGLRIAVLACLIDQAAKFWLFDVFDIANRPHYSLNRFTEIVLAWNTGISYGLLPQQGVLGQSALLIFKAVAVVFLWAWLSRSTSRLTAAALGLIIGGAIGNAIDRLHWPGVLDFVLFHLETGSFSFRWYVFNLADVAIVAGVIGLLYDSLRAGSAAKAPRSDI